MKRHHGKSQEQAGRFPLLTQAGTGRIFTNEMEEASTQNWSELVSKYAETGYLLLRQFLKRDKVKRARKYIVQELEKEGYLKPNSEFFVRPNMRFAKTEPFLLDCYTVSIFHRVKKC
eukprot:TRINITY_DN9989_c0_g1_i4.p1 TRINITY_DN9989_c0_g1~~TRINITY_DN9989_c0_g1_i4.p1  ORF type:complete len:117 (-),score=13.35 TRINITY_DN9989_c0_g1_i4:859-1209(-)